MKGSEAKRMDSGTGHSYLLAVLREWRSQEVADALGQEAARWEGNISVLEAYHALAPLPIGDLLSTLLASATDVEVVSFMGYILENDPALTSNTEIAYEVEKAELPFPRHFVALCLLCIQRWKDTKLREIRESVWRSTVLRPEPFSDEEYVELLLHLFTMDDLQHKCMQLLNSADEVIRQNAETLAYRVGRDSISLAETTLFKWQALCKRLFGNTRG